VTNSSSSSIEKRAGELDTIAAVLPIGRRDELAELLTEEDVEHSAISSMRALARIPCGR
jgi:hypothetical protein